MTTQDNLWTGLRRLIKPGLQGAGIAVAFMTVVLLINWARNTYTLAILIPLSTIAVGGASGGVFYYMVARVLYPEKWWSKIFAALMFVGACYLGLVFGLSLKGDWN